MSGQPTLDGIISNDVAEPPKVMIRTRKKTIVPRSKTQAVYMEALARDEMIFALGPAGTGNTYLAVAPAVPHLVGGSDRKRAVEGKSVSVSVYRGGRRLIQQKTLVE